MPEGSDYYIRLTATAYGSFSPLPNIGMLFDTALVGPLTSDRPTINATLTQHLNAGRLDYSNYYSCYQNHGLDAFDLHLGSDNRWTDDNGCTGPVVPEGCSEITAYNYYHKSAGRAYSNGSALTPDYFASGSDDAMPGSTWGFNTLHSNDSGVSWAMGNCP